MSDMDTLKYYEVSLADYLNEAVKDWGYTKVVEVLAKMATIRAKTETAIDLRPVAKVLRETVDRLDATMTE